MKNTRARYGEALNVMVQAICLWGIIFIIISACAEKIAKREAAHVVASVPALERPAVAPPVVKTGNTTVDTATQREADARSTVAALRKDLTVAEADLKQAHQDAEDAKRQAEVERLQAICSWVAGLCLLAAVGMLVAAFFLPFGRSWLLGGAAGCGGGLVLALTLRQVLPWLAVGGLVIGLILAAVGVVLLIRKYHGALLAAIDHGERMEEAAGGKTQAVVKKVLDSSVAQQVESGVQNLIKRVRGK